MFRLRPTFGVRGVVAGAAAEVEVVAIEEDAAAVVEEGEEEAEEVEGTGEEDIDNIPRHKSFTLTSNPKLKRSNRAMIF